MPYTHDTGVQDLLIPPNPADRIRFVVHIWSHIMGEYIEKADTGYTLAMVKTDIEYMLSYRRYIDPEGAEYDPVTIAGTTLLDLAKIAADLDDDVAYPTKPDKFARLRTCKNVFELYKDPGYTRLQTRQHLKIRLGFVNGT